MPDHQNEPKKPEDETKGTVPLPIIPNSAVAVVAAAAFVGAAAGVIATTMVGG